MTALRAILLAAAVAGAGLLSVQAQADRVRITMPDGTRWRGDTGDQIKVTYAEGRRRLNETGVLKAVETDWIVLTPKSGQDVTIWISDLISVEKLEGATAPAADPDPDGADAKPSGNPDSGPTSNPASGPDDGSSDADADAIELPNSLKFDPSKGMPVFYLPMEGMVGGEFREEEIRAIAAEADLIGPGQTIVLHIDSGGGLVAEWQLIWQTIQDIKKRHRVVAWVKTAISAAASTSLACSFIVFEDSGSMGSITTLMGSSEAPMEMQERGAAELKEVLRQGGYSEHFARPFKIMKAEVSYDKDPETGICTFYPHAAGEYVLSDNQHVLTLNSREAIHCGMAVGLANTKEELGELLDLGGWNEVGTGQETFDSWSSDCVACKRDIQLLGSKLQRMGKSEKDLRETIRIIRIFMRWWDRTPNICFLNGVPPKSQLELMLEEAQQRLREMNQRR